MFERDEHLEYGDRVERSRGQQGQAGLGYSVTQSSQGRLRREAED